jgi:hypothetical protein
MLQDFRDLRCDILLSCKNKAMDSIERARQQLVSLIEEVKTVDVAQYSTGHGYEKKDGKTHLVLPQLREEEGWVADSGVDAGNICIQTDLIGELEKAANDSTFFVFLIDACRTKPPKGSVVKVFPLGCQALLSSWKQC